MMFFKRKPAAPAEPPLDWRLLEHGAVTLYHKGSVLAQDLAWLRHRGYAVHELDASRWTDAAAFHASARQTLAFPSYYANNLASWIECLDELAVPDESGLALVFRSYDAFAAAQPALAQTVLDSIASASRRSLLTGRRLLALVQSNDPRIRFERIGAVPVNWNPREWTDQDRGLRAEG